MVTAVFPKMEIIIMLIMQNVIIVTLRLTNIFIEKIIFL